MEWLVQICGIEPHIHFLWICNKRQTLRIKQVFFDSYSNTYKKKDDKVFHDYEGTLPDPASKLDNWWLIKNKHFKILLLSYYYNLYGPNVYYHLLTPISAGQVIKKHLLRR